ncbi:MAG TPA: TetR/AcrR family transcriptional regulator [Lacipirellula sp.]
MPASTRERLIDAAQRRFYRDGFRNVGIDQVLADVGISKTAFYKHFESKDDLMLAVLEKMNVWLQELLREVTSQRADRNPAEQLRQLFDVVDQIIAAEEYHGCIFVNVAMEFPLPHEPAHQAAAAHKQAIEAIVRELAAQAGANDPLALAKELCLIMEGAYVTRQVTSDPQTIQIARRVADAVIASQLPVASR